MARIVIDPGHSGSPDPGAVGPSGLRESDVVLMVAKSLQGILLADRHEVQLTRSEQEDPASDDLGYRTDMANEFEADLFLSIHCNAVDTPEAHGTETYYYTQGSENSMKLASLVQQELLAATQLTSRGLKTANYWVLKYTNMPAVLAELAFISNPEEEALLADQGFCTSCALALYKAIHRYLTE